jgi:DinB superfamily
MAAKKSRSKRTHRSAKKKAAPDAASKSTDAALRRQIVELIDSEHAFVSWKKALDGVPEHVRGIKPAGSPHSLWQLLEHLRLAASDILEFSRDPKHVSPEWPSGYWPAADAPASDKDWQKSLREFGRDLNEMKELVLDPKTDLFAKIKHGTGQTILREAMLVAAHNAYHIGQFVLIRRLLGAWPVE